MDTHSLSYLEKEFLELITASGKREEINKYLYRIDLIKKYLPHLNDLESFGRKKKNE